MARATGAKSYIYFAQESTWGTSPVTGAVYGIPFRSASIGSSRNLFQSETINQYRSVIANNLGNKAVQGNIVTDLLPEGLEVLFAHLLGGVDTVVAGVTVDAVATSGTTDAYTHVLKGVANTREGLTIEKAFTNIEITGKYFLFNGCRVNSCAIDIVQEGFVGCTFEVIGTNETVRTATYLGDTAAMTDNTDLTFDAAVTTTSTGFTGYQCAVKAELNPTGAPGVMTTLGYVTTGNINITNNIETDGYVLGFDYRKSAEHGRRECTGSFTIFFEDTTLFAHYLSGQEVKLQFVFTNTTSPTKSLTIEFPKCTLGGQSPEITGFQGVNMTFNFNARWDSTAKTDVIMTFVNSTVSIPA